MFTVKKNALLNAVKKVSGFMEKTLVITQMEIPFPEKEGKYVLSIKAAGAKAQGEVLLAYAAAEGINDMMYLSDNSVKIILGLSNYGEQYSFTKMEDCVVVTCGEARVTLPLEKEAMMLGAADANGLELVIVKAAGKSFISSVLKGAFAHGGENEAMNRRVCLCYEKKDGRAFINMLSCDGIIGACGILPVVVADEYAAVFDKWVSERRQTVLPAEQFMAIARAMDEANDVEMIITGPQVAIGSGSEAYTMVTFDAAYPQILGMIMETNIDFGVSVDASALKAAMAVLQLQNTKEALKLKFREESDGMGTLEITGYRTEKDRIPMEKLKGTGTMCIYVNPNELAKILGAYGGTVTIKGASSARRPKILLSPEKPEEAVSMLSLCLGPSELKKQHKK